MGVIDQLLLGGAEDLVENVGGSLGFGTTPGEQAADATTEAAQVQADYQGEALEYLKERERLPQQYREGALTGLAGVAGLEGGGDGQQEMIQRAMASPLYKSIMGGREAGEESILRNVSAIGKLKSGTAAESLYDYNVQLENKALLESYNQQMSGLQGLAGLSSLAPQIAQQTSGIGQTLAQGKTGAAQALQAGSQQEMGNMMGLGQLGILAYGAGMFSDRRLKKNIKQIGTHDGMNIYSWDWNKVAQNMGLTGKTVGVMADEIYEVKPEAVSVKNFFMFVDYAALGILKLEVVHA